MQKFICTANLINNPEISQTQSGISVCKFGIAINRNYTNADGNREADFFNVIVWRTKAENCHKFLKKGSKVAIEGTIQNRSYTDKDGVKRTVCEINCSEIEFIGKPQNSENETVQNKRPALVEIQDNQLPF